MFSRYLCCFLIALFTALPLTSSWVKIWGLAVLAHGANLMVAAVVGVHWRDQSLDKGAQRPHSPVALLPLAAVWPAARQRP